jgi:hypothetical protein
MIGIGIGIPFGRRGGFTGVLDLYPNAAMAYSLRKLSKAYTGSAVRIRRSGDNTESDFGFLANGDFDASAASAFIIAGGGAQLGFVTTWYDQSGNSRNVTQATAARQPKISINNFNGKTTLLFDTANTFLQGLFGVFTFTGAGDVFIPNSSSAADINSYGSYLHQGNSVGTARSQLMLTNQTFPNTTVRPSIDSYAGIIASTLSNTTLNEKCIFRFSWSNYSTAHSNGNTVISKNGAAYSLTFPSSATSLLTNKTTIGFTDDNGSGASRQFLGEIPEIISYTSQQANQSSIISNQESYYGI